MSMELEKLQEVKRRGWLNSQVLDNQMKAKNGMLMNSTPASNPINTEKGKPWQEEELWCRTIRPPNLAFHHQQFLGTFIGRPSWNLVSKLTC